MIAADGWSLREIVPAKIVLRGIRPAYAYRVSAHEPSLTEFIT